MNVDKIYKYHELICISKLLKKGFHQLLKYKIQKGDSLSLFKSTAIQLKIFTNVKDVSVIRVVIHRYPHYFTNRKILLKYAISADNLEGLKFLVTEFNMKPSQSLMEYAFDNKSIETSKYLVEEFKLDPPTNIQKYFDLDIPEDQHTRLDHIQLMYDAISSNKDLRNSVKFGDSFYKLLKFNDFSVFIWFVKHESMPMPYSENSYLQYLDLFSYVDPNEIVEDQLKIVLYIERYFRNNTTIDENQYLYYSGDTNFKNPSHRLYTSFLRLMLSISYRFPGFSFIHGALFALNNQYLELFEEILPLVPVHNFKKYSLDVVDYQLFLNLNKRGIYFDKEETLENAVKIGSMELIRHYLSPAEKNSKFRLNLYYIKFILKRCIQENQYGIFEEIITQYYPLLKVENQHSILNYAAKMGDLRVFKYLHKLNFKSESDSELMDTVAKSGNLDLVRFCHFNRIEGCTTKAIDNATEGGHLGIVQFLLNSRTEGFFDAPKYALKHHHFDIFKELFIRMGNNSNSFEIPFEYSIPSIIIYMIEQSPPYVIDIKPHIMLLDQDRPDILEFLFNQFKKKGMEVSNDFLKSIWKHCLSAGLSENLEYLIQKFPDITQSSIDYPLILKFLNDNRPGSMLMSRFLLSHIPFTIINSEIVNAAVKGYKLEFLFEEIGWSVHDHIGDNQIDLILRRCSPSLPYLKYCWDQLKPPNPFFILSQKRKEGIKISRENIEYAKTLMPAKSNFSSKKSNIKNDETVVIDFS
eukprot:gene1971-2423_t